MEQDKMGEVCGLQDAHHSQRVPVWRARRPRQGGEAAFCLDRFCSSSAVLERFLDLASFCRHDHSCVFGNNKTRRIAEGPVSGKGRTECRNAGTVNHGTKRSVCCGRVLGPFNVPMAVDGRGFHFPAVSTAWQQQW